MKISPNPTRWVRNRTFPLLIALILLIAFSPLFVASDGFSSDLFPIVALTIPLLGLLSLSTWKRALPMTLAFVVLVPIAYIFFRFDQVAIARSPIAFLSVIYYGYAIIALASVLLRDTALIDDRVYGGLSIYILTALMFGVIHRHISAVDPSAYANGLTNQSSVLLWNHALYFSLSTVTTVGYGDIVPRSDWARAMSMLEAVIGVAITIVFIARLASVPRTNHQHH